jgi:hypothetical protein
MCKIKCCLKHYLLVVAAVIVAVVVVPAAAVAVIDNVVVVAAISDLAEKGKKVLNKKKFSSIAADRQFSNFLQYQVAGKLIQAILMCFLN